MSRAKTSASSPTRPAAGKAQRVGERSFGRQAGRHRPRKPRQRPKAPQRLLLASPLSVLRRVPRVAWLCALVAFLNAASWSIITPPFQVPDEPEHIAYVKVLAETGHRPAQTGYFTAEEGAALEELHLQSVAEQQENRPISSRAAQQKLEHELKAEKGPPTPGSEYAGVAASQPPLYYAIEAIPFSLGAGGTLLDRIELMRLVSALMGGLTALFTFLFLRELLPRVRWAWTVGGVGVALVPLFGFMSGAVNPDAMLYAVAAALFYTLARGFRIGLTRWAALAIGAVIAIGLLTKLNFVGLAPGAMLGLVVLSVREARTRGRAAYVSLALALGVALSPVGIYILYNIATGASALGFVLGPLESVHAPLAELSYIWQLYLPRLPGMHDDFAGLFTPLQIWFRGYVGLYGWLDTTFPGWVYDLALIPAATIVALCVRGLALSGAALRVRVVELAVYASMCLGLMVLIGGDSFVRFPLYDAEFGQARYLLPFLPLLGAVLALAARGAGRRWGPIVGASIILLFLGHDVLSQLQEIARFYG